MNITILANRDLASCFALNYLISGLASHRLKIFLSEQVGANQPVSNNSVSNNRPNQLVELKFFEQQLFNQIVFPACDQQTNQTSKLLTFNGLATIIDNPIETLNHINQDSGIQQLKASRPDLILSIRFGQILKQEAINVPALGVLNLHSGILPQYQGVMATFRAMLNQDEEYGSTLHFIDSAAIDAGPVVNIQKQPLDLNKSYIENVLALYPQGCRAMIKAVNQINQDAPLTTAAMSGEASYFSFPKQDDFQQFANLNLKLIDTQHIMQLVKAYQGVES